MSCLRRNNSLRHVAAIVALVVTMLPATVHASVRPPSRAFPVATDNQSVPPDQTRAPLVRSTTVSRYLTREVFGFATSASLADPTVGYPSWNFDLLSTVAFFAIRVNYDGVLVANSDWNVWDSNTLTGLVTTAHQHGVKVVVTLVPLYHDLIDFCDTLYNDQTTVLQIVNQVRLKGIDGVNIDYEGQLGQCNPTSPGLVPMTNQALLTRFAKDLRAGLDAVAPGYYLSIDTYSGSAGGTDGFFNIPDLNRYVDSFFVMAYDMDQANQGLPPLNCASFCMGPIAPLTNYFWNDTRSMTQYSAVAGPGKTILGQPYYGRAACVASPSAHANAIGPVVAVTYLDAAGAINSPDIQPGTYSIQRDPDDPTGLDRWDAWYDNSLGCWREMYWQDVTTLSVRYDLVNQLSLRGVGFWTLNYGGGAPELWRAIQTKFVACANTAVSGNPGPPQLSGTQIQLMATSSRCLNPRYEFWMLPPGGTWSVIQPYSASATFNWNTIGKPAGAYRFSVWAQDINSPGTFGSAPYTYDSFGAVDYPLTTSPCTAMTATAAPPTTTLIGVAVAITGSATGCPKPLYEVWILPPGGSWSVAQPYSTNSTFNWITTGMPAGTYHFSVWAQDRSSLGTSGAYPFTYDAFSGMSYSVTVPSCSGTTASPAPSSTANTGTPITITAGVTGCPNPLYEFWLLPPGGTWSVVAPYSTNATFNWNTTGKQAGLYRFSVWARDVASQNAYDSFNAFQYALTTAPCAAMSASQAPPSSANVGTTVTVSGSATGCPNPLYEFWVLPSGGTWTLAQPFSSTATFNWNTAGKPAGSYRFSVWGRDISSSGTSGSSPYTYDAFSAFQYALTTTPCTAISASLAPPSSANAGTTVTVTGSATGCPNPLYEFWVLPPGGTWALAQPFSSTATFNWNTAGKPAGSYRFSVWGRDISSSGTSGSSPYTYDAFSAFQYTLS